MKERGVERRVKAPPVPEILAMGRDRRVKDGRELASASGSDILSVYLAGGPAYELDGIRYRVSPPMAILIPAGTVDHDLQSGPVDGLFVLFRGRGLLARARPGSVAVAASTHAPARVVPVLKRLGHARASRLADLLRRIGGVSSTSQEGLLLRGALLLEALSVYCGDRGEALAAGVHREAQRLRDLLDARAFETIPLARLYQELAVSPSRAATLFSRAFGRSPVAYRTAVRLGRARELLVTTRCNVSEAAYAVGFADPLYFSRAFRERFGASPSSLIRSFAATRGG